MSKAYTTKSGDTWDLIAYDQLGSCSYMNLLIDANRQHVGTAIFSAGVVLQLPEITTETQSTALPPWRK